MYFFLSIFFQIKTQPTIQWLVGVDKIDVILGFVHKADGLKRLFHKRRLDIVPL